MKKNVFGVFVLFLLCTCLFASGGKETVVQVSEDSYKWNLEGTIFPLEKKISFNILTSGYRSADVRKIDENEDWKALEAQTNVDINFIYLGDYDATETRDSLQMRLLSGDYCDAIMSVYVNNLTMEDINELASSGIVINLDKYITDPKCMPNLYYSVIEPKQNIYNNMKSPDGNIYYLAGVSEINAYTANEGLMQVNSDWLQSWKDSRGIDHSPETLEEFDDMLSYFYSSDLNKNGMQDEIPYMIAQCTFNGCMTLEHAMGMYGIATKDSTADMDIMIDDDGNVFFAYTTDMYKDALIQFADWYKKGYIWKDAFTGNSETVTEIMTRAKDVVGVFNMCENIEGFEPLLPPTIEGYQARYHMHPSVRVGVRQPYAVITDKCKNPDILCSFLDLWFQFDNQIRIRYGKVNYDNNGVYFDENGKYSFNNIDITGKVDNSNNSIGAFISYMEADTIENFNDRVDIDSFFGDQQRVKGFELYNEKDLWNPTENLWPRCSILTEYADDYAFMYTDVSSTVAEYRAKFVTGVYDVNQKWDEFQSKIKKLGVEKMRDIVQASYDAYLK